MHGRRRIRGDYPATIGHKVDADYGLVLPIQRYVAYTRVPPLPELIGSYTPANTETAHSLSEKNFSNLQPLTPGSRLYAYVAVLMLTAP
jgi:hypothetical protein